jgi:imidazolonepropionase-like amidohydrolase
MEESKKEAARQLRLLEESFAKARAYLAAKKAGDPEQKTDLRWEAMAPVLAGEVPIYVNAYHLKQITAAIAFADEQKVKMVLVGRGDVARAAPLLKAHDIPVIISGVNELPDRRWENYDSPMRVPLVLHEAGVRFCIASNGGSMTAAHERNLPYEAARAAAFGLPKEVALKAVTLYPAQILGVGGRLGSLEAGKDATLMVTSGDPLEITTAIDRAFIGGRQIDLANKQTKLYDKYQEKYRQLKGGQGTP